MLTLAEDDVHAFEEGDEIILLKVSRNWLLEHALDYGVESRHEVLLVDVEGLSCSHIDDLECAQEPRKNV